MSMENDKIMTAERLQDYLHLTRRTIYKLIRDRKIPCARVGGSWRFNKDRIDEWLRDREIVHQEGLEKKKKTKILIVDDVPVILEAIGEGLRSKMPEAHVKTADNGVKALLAVGKEKPDIMILDIEIPEMNGIEVCRKLKEDPETSDIFIIAVTGFADKGYKEKIMNAGANAFLEKPFGPHAVINIIKEHLEVRSKNYAG